VRLGSTFHALNTCNISNSPYLYPSRGLEICVSWLNELFNDAAKSLPDLCLTAQSCHFFVWNHPVYWWSLSYFSVRRSPAVTASVLPPPPPQFSANSACIHFTCWLIALEFQDYLQILTYLCLLSKVTIQVLEIKKDIKHSNKLIFQVGHKLAWLKCLFSVIDYNFRFSMGYYFIIF
jgi:hypothetical protein